MKKLSIVMVTYLEENFRYLCLAIDSLSRQKGVDFELILVSSGRFNPNVDHIPKTNLLNLRHHHSEERLHYPSAINYGMKLIRDSSKYVMMANDDLIFTKDSLLKLMDSFDILKDSNGEEMPLILNPLSSCDNHWAFWSPLKLITEEGESIGLSNRFYRYDELKDHFELIMNSMHYDPIYKNFYPWMLINRSSEYIAFYCTTMQRRVWDLIGELDSNLKTGFDDNDYSRRARQHNIPLAIAVHSFVLHFGGATADIALTEQDREDNVIYFTNKWNLKQVTS